jgi:hypothetical protein
MSLPEQKCFVTEEICVRCVIKLFLKNVKKHTEFQSVFIVFIPSGVYAFVMHMYFSLLLTLRR